MIVTKSPAPAATRAGAKESDGHPIVAAHRSGVESSDVAVAAVAALDGATAVVVRLVRLGAIR